METFATYILSEEDWVKKLEIAYYLKKKVNIFFNNTVIFKTVLAKLFLDHTDLKLDKNFSDMNKVKTYAKEGAEYLKRLGFDERFCRICEQINRYSGLEPREPEADVLELVDQFGGMLLDRPERIGFKCDEALVLLEFRNLKDKNNRYLEEFKDFVNRMEAIKI